MVGGAEACAGNGEMIMSPFGKIEMSRAITRRGEVHDENGRPKKEGLELEGEEN